MLICTFELFYVSLGQFIAAMAPNELLASLMVPFFFLFIMSFAGIVVPYMAQPYFWRSWMYWVTPFHYLLEAMLTAVTHNVPVDCSEDEFARFSAPPGQTCASYTDDFVRQYGGYVNVGADGLCEYCQYANGDEFVATFNVYYRNKWRDYGLQWLYIAFNFAVVFFCSWLYLGGAKKIGKFFSPKARKQAREERVVREKV
jgi:ATP-binding cassette subfamily G (WHITE) protein 2 (SNQ2)